MSSQFFGLNIAYTGLLASNAALNTTSNNIANVQTEGFSRQKVTQRAANALRVFQTYGCAGAGVETLAIERVRDQFYDMRYWNNNAKLGEYSQKQYYMKQVEAYFDDNGVNAGFKTVFDQLMVKGLQELKKNPSVTAYKQQFVGYAQSLTEYFNSVSANLQNVQKDANEEIKVKVDEINSIASEVATLNKQINTIELTGVWANELRDKRDLLMDRLSEVVDVEIKEMAVGETTNADSGTSAHRYIVRIAGGQILVDGNGYNGLECKSRTPNEKVNQTDIDGLYDVYWADGSRFNLHNGAMRGELKGIVDMRDGNNSEGFTGNVTEVNTADNTVTVSVGKHYLTDLNKCNLSENGGIINLGNKEYYYESWTYTAAYNVDKGEMEYSYKFQLSNPADGLNASAVTSDRQGKAATIGKSIAYQGVPYYLSQMNEWIRTFAQKFNDIMTSGFSAENPGIDLFSANKPDGGQYSFDDEYRYDNIEERVKAKGTFTLPVGRGITGRDSYYLMTAGNFDISIAVENNPDLLATRTKEQDGVEQDDLLEQVKRLGTNKNSMSFRGSSASEFLQCILADVSLNTSRVETFYASYSDIASSIETQRISISGVDEDEEAVNLVRYQNGYNLASKMIQILTEVYDRLILETGV